MNSNKPCRIRNCSKERHYNSSLCFVHFKKRENEKKKKKAERKKHTKKYKQNELKKWKKKTWKLMSVWVRKSRADWRGYVECYTCRKKLQWKEAHCGHYQHGKLDYDERNLKPQCPGCNTYRGGRLDEYTMRLISENGIDWVEKLRNDATQEKHISLDEIKEIYHELQRKIDLL